MEDFQDFEDTFFAECGPRCGPQALARTAPLAKINDRARAVRAKKMSGPRRSPHVRCGDCCRPAPRPAVITAVAGFLLITSQNVIPALFTHLGVIVGTLVTVNPVLSPALQGLGIAGLQGLAAGTILYVTFFEVLDKERKRDSTPGLIKLAFVILGFCLMICLELLGGHSHSHHDHDELIPCNTTCNTTLMSP
ncbi:hypothetical protein WDU94_000473 [Cyamophila willieti]